MEEQVILDVQINADKVIDRLEIVNRSMSELKKLNSDLAKEMKATGDATGELSAKMAANNKEIEMLKGEQKSLVGQLQNVEKANFSLGDSYEEINARVKQMQKEYKALTAEQRNSEGGQALLKQIQQQKDALKDMDASLGDHFRNVGNYPQVMSGAFGKIDGILAKFGTNVSSILGGGLEGLKTGLASTGKAVVSFGKTLLTTPLGWLLAMVAALIAIFDKLAEAFRKNDDAGTDLAVAMSALKPISTLISKIFDGIAVVLGKVALGIASVIKGIGSLIPGFEEAAEAAQQLTKAEDELQEKERKYTTESAERNKQIAELRANAVDKEKYTAKEREAFLQQAIDLEKKNLEQEKELKAERLRILQEKAKQEVDTSDATKDAIAKAQADLYASETNYFDRSKKLQSQLLTARKENNDAQTKAEQEAFEKRKAMTEEELRLKLEAQASEKEIAQALQDYTISLIKDEGQKAMAERKINGEREIADLQNRLDTEKNLTDKAKTDLATLIKIKREQLNSDLKQMAIDNANKVANDAIEQELKTKELKLQTLKQGTEEYNAVQKEIWALQLEQELENTVLTEEQKLLIKEEYKQKAEQLDEDYFKNYKSMVQQAKDQYAQSMMSTVGAASSAFGAMSNLLAQYGEDNEEAAKASKAFAIAQIVTDQAINIANTARAITTAIAGANEAAAAGGPLAPILQAIYMAQMVGSVLAGVASVAGSIAQAKQVLSQNKFAEGGIVEGTSYAGDKVPARVNSGEMILTRQQQSTLFDIANGRTQAGGLDYEALAVAMANTPAPILDYQEFNTFKGKVVQYDEIAKL